MLYPEGLRNLPLREQVGVLAGLAAASLVLSSSAVSIAEGANEAATCVPRDASVVDRMYTELKADMAAPHTLPQSSMIIQATSKYNIATVDTTPYVKQLSTIQDPQAVLDYTNMVTVTKFGFSTKAETNDTDVIQDDSVALLRELDDTPPILIDPVVDHVVLGSDEGLREAGVPADLYDKSDKTIYFTKGLIGARWHETGHGWQARSLDRRCGWLASDKYKDNYLDDDFTGLNPAGTTYGASAKRTTIIDSYANTNDAEDYGDTFSSVFHKEIDGTYTVFSTTNWPAVKKVAAIGADLEAEQPGLGSYAMDLWAINHSDAPFPRATTTSPYYKH